MTTRFSITNHLFRPVLGVAAAVGLAAGSASAAAPSPRPAPARVTAAKHLLFRVRGPNGATVFLLGSVHLLSPDAATLPPEVDAAFAQAKSVGFETSIDTLQMRAQELLMRAQFSNGATLRSSLSPATLAHADSIVSGYGMRLDQLNSFKPWFVSVVLTQLVLQKMNFKAELGVDMQLHAKAKAASKPEFGLESTDFQLGLFDSLSPKDQEDMLKEVVAPDSAAKQLTAIRDAWSAGNATALDSLINSGMKSSPGVYTALITNRNRSWIPKLESLIRGKDDALVVVGAGHLVGKDGVVELLRAKGYTIEQM
jgi:uncharacterized protein YbaP (TraB family)